MIVQSVAKNPPCPPVYFGAFKVNEKKTFLTASHSGKWQVQPKQTDRRTNPVTFDRHPDNNGRKIMKKRKEFLQLDNLIRILKVTGSD